MSDIDVIVSEEGSTNVTIGAGLVSHFGTHISGGTDQIDHNLLSGLQGGSSEERYHLTEDQYSKVTGIGFSTLLQFSTLIPSGVEETGILFAQEFASVPNVQISLETPYEYTYLVGIKNITESGFIASFSDLIGDTGFRLQTLATNF